MKEFKIRCSAIGHIMAGSMELTDKQKADLLALQVKDKLTALQAAKLNILLDKRDNPELPEGVKTYCKDWLKGQLFDYQKMLKNKYVDKGNIMEDESIDFIADQLGFGFLVKNEESKSDEYMEGTADVVLSDLIIDAKNSWDCSTFPFFETEIPNNDYYWQGQGYMNLYNKDRFKLIYCLLDTPENLIHNEARWYSISQGFEELDNAIYEQFHKNMTYKNVPNKFKIKVFNIDRNNADIKRIKERVLECRKYIEQLKFSSK